MRCEEKITELQSNIDKITDESEELLERIRSDRADTEQERELHAQVKRIWMNEWPLIPIDIMLTYSEGAILMRNAYNDMYSGNS